MVCSLTRTVIVSSGHLKDGLTKRGLSNVAVKPLLTVWLVFLLFGLIICVLNDPWLELLLRTDPPSIGWWLPTSLG